MLTVRKGITADYGRMKEFITEAGSPFSEGCMYILAENERKDIIGVVGLKLYGEQGLLRSFVCSPAFPSAELPVLLEQMLMLAKEQQCREVFLVTALTTGQTLFEVLGFKERDSNLPIESDLSTDIKNLTRDRQAKIMWKNLSL